MVLNLKHLFRPDTLLKKTDNLKLYVCLSACWHATKEYPIFQRATWQEYLDGLIICLDDPTRRKINHEVTTYFFGEKDSNYVDLVVKIASKLASIYKIKNDNLFFISNSNGGFASLQCATKIAGANAIVFNPNISMQIYLRTKRTGETNHDKLFEKIFDVSFADEKLFDRFSVKKIIYNDKSRYFIYFNKASRNDFDQLKYLADGSEIDITKQLQKIGNVTIFCNNAPAKSPHMFFPNHSAFWFIENLLKKDQIEEQDNKAFDLLTSYMRELGERERKIVELTKKLQ